MKTFSHSPKYWPLENDCRLNLVLIETRGRDLDDFITNAEISIADWHGNEGPQWTLDDLHSKDYDAVVRLFNEHLAQEPT